MSHNTNRKRSQSITLVLLGVATLAPGCASIQPASDSDVYLSEAECVDVWQDPLKCGYINGVDDQGVERVYWYYKGMGRIDPASNGPSVDHRFLVSSNSPGISSSVWRRGFGGLRRHFGGVFA